MNLGKAIKLCRIQRELSQEELAQAAGISVSYLSLLERNKRDPNLSTVETVAVALDMPLFLLLYMAEDNHRLWENALGEKLAMEILRNLGGKG